MKILKEFKTFISRGNVMDLAVAVIIGGAFGKIITSLVNDIIMPVLGLILGNINLTDQKIVLRPAYGDMAEAALTYGKFIQTLIDFLLIAVVIFLIIKALNTVSTKLRKPKESAPAAPPPPSNEEVLLTDIKDLLIRIEKK
jgi:large conductance mechanosensitive channel